MRPFEGLFTKRLPSAIFFAVAILSPLRGFPCAILHPRLAPWAAFLRRFAARAPGPVQSKSFSSEL